MNGFAALLHQDTPHEKAPVACGWVLLPAHQSHARMRRKLKDLSDSRLEVIGRSYLKVKDEAL